MFETNVAKPVATAKSLAALSREIYQSGPWLARKFLHLRPYICPLDRVLPFVPHGSRVLDVGCGGGLLLGLLAASGASPSGTGFDSNPRAIALAQDMAELVERRGVGGSLTFLRQDVEAAWPAATFDVVALVDVLHHVPPHAQRATVEQAAARVGPGGSLVYKDIARRPAWRASMNRLHDLAVAHQWVHYVDAGDVETWAAGSGLRLEHGERIDRLWYGHDLRVFRRTFVGGDEELA